MTKAARRKILLKNLVKARKAQAKKRNQLKQEAKHVEGPSFHSGYILGKVETIIEYYCAGKSISPATIADELGALLRHSQSR